MANRSSVRYSLSSALLLVFLFGSRPVVTALRFSFNFTGPDGVKNAKDIIVLEGDASTTISGIQLTKPSTSQDVTGNSGRALYRDTIRLWDAASGVLLSFSTHFSFKIGQFPNMSSGDGFAFFLASPSERLIPANSGGGDLGLFNNTANRVVAVEFDSFSNDFDPSMNHIGIDVHSIKSIALSTMVNFSITNGSNTPLATVAYDGRAKNLTVLLTYSSADPSVEGRTWTVSSVVDLRNYLPEEVVMGFSATTGLSAEEHAILSWDFNSTVLEIRSPAPAPGTKPLEIVTRKKVESKKVLLGVVSGYTLLLCALALAWLGMWQYWRKKHRRGAVDNKWSAPRSFRYEDLAAATANFAEARKLGEGGFGAVFKGVLQEVNNIFLDVAIKKISRRSTQGEKQYLTEITLFSQLRHRNLVHLIGYCQEREEFLLVYQYMPNRSLDMHLYDADGVLGWAERYNVAKGLAAALLYLHEECEQCVLHRDIKPSNVMLDLEFNAKLGDFGLAKLFEHDLSAVTTMLAGTKGYIAPEYEKTGRARRESDVYSFGVVALEMACGRRAIAFTEEAGKIYLTERVWELYEKGACLEAVDPKLNGEFEEHEMERLMVVGLWCAHPDYTLRPSIRRALEVLSFVAPSPELQHPEGIPRPNNYHVHRLTPPSTTSLPAPVLFPPNRALTAHNALSFGLLIEFPCLLSGF